MNERDDDRPSKPREDDMSQDYDFEDALEKEWREVYDGRPGRDADEPTNEREAGPADPAAA